jgi:hypothetical protein
MIRRLGVAASPTMACVLLALRHKSMRTKIANRRNVELFHAKKFIKPTRLAIAAPHIAEEWDFDRNPLYVYPQIVGVASLSTYWWKCKDCGHRFQDTAERRVIRGHGCPQCAIKAADLRNSRAVDEIITQSPADKASVERSSSGKVKKRLKGRRRKLLFNKNRKNLLHSRSKGPSKASQQSQPSQQSANFPSALAGEVNEMLRPKLTPPFR